MPFGSRAMVADALVYPGELQSIRRELIVPLEDELLMRTVLSPKTDDPAWAETIGYDRMSKSGTARIMNLMATDIPLVDVSMARYIQRVYQIASGFRLYEIEIEAARAAGRPIQPVKTATVRRYMAEEEDSVVANGSQEVALEGIFTLTGRLEDAATAKNNANNTYWASCTEGEGSVIVAHLRQLRALHATLAGHEPRVLMVSKQMAEYFSLYVNDQKTLTVMDLIRSQGWWAGGIVRIPTMSNTKIASLDNRPDRLGLSITKDTDLLPEWRNSPFSSIIAAEERTGALVAYYPTAVAVLTGVASA